MSSPQAVQSPRVPEATKDFFVACPHIPEINDNPDKAFSDILDTNRERSVHQCGC
jgi:hypothetical protein